MRSTANFEVPSVSPQGRRTPRRWVALAVVAAAALGLGACSDGNGAGSGNGGGNGGGNGNGSGGDAGASAAPGGNDSDEATAIPRGDVAARLDALPVGDPTADEIAGLVRMREEELLAHDVYVALGERWDVKVFANISAAEQTHTDAVKALLDRYSIDDPAADHVAGSFADPELQDLYISLVDDGNRSLVDALAVGATVEELDLADLAERSTDAPDIAWVYENLARGSRNHLRAFVRQLDRNGADYSPTHITQDEFDSIVAGETERGSGG